MKKNTKVFKLLVGLVLFCQACIVHGVCLGDKSSTPVFKVYIVPQLTATQIYTRWVPVLERIGKESSHCFELIVPSSIPQFEKDLSEGRPDFAYMNPYHAVMRWKNSHYIPLIASSEPIFGILTVAKESPIGQVKDLSGGRIAFPAPNAFAASLLIRATLAKDGVPYEPVYVKTHSNVYRSVARGGIQSTLISEPAELKSELRTLMETKRYTSHPFSANERIPEHIQRKIQNSFILLGQTSEGEELLKGTQLVKPMKVSYKANYELLESLRLDRFVVKSAE